MNEPIKIDEEFRTLLPPLSEDEYKKLSEQLCEHGIRDPLKVWNGVLIDGHNRYQISEENDLNYTIDDMTDEFKNRAEVMKWIIDNQGARRNLAPSQLIKAYEKYEAELTKEAKERQAENMRANQKQNAQKSSNLNETEAIRTAAEVAKKMGMSENTYRDMKVVVNEGTPEQIERMDKKKKVANKDGSVKPTSASGIKKEIAVDKKVVEEYGSDDQKKRLEEGGDGNKPTEIADEIRKEGKAQDVNSFTTKVCTKCGKLQPISMFEKDRSICKACRSGHGKTVRDAKGNKIKFSGQYNNVSDKEILSGMYDKDKEVKTTSKEVRDRFEGDFRNFYISIDRILEEIENGDAEDNVEETFIKCIDDVIEKLANFKNQIKEKERKKDAC